MSEPAAPSVPSSPQSDISDPVAEINRLKKEMEEKTRQMEEKTRQMEEMKKRNAQLQQQIDANTSKQSSKASEVRTVYRPTVSVINAFTSDFAGDDSVIALELHFGNCATILNKSNDLIYLPYISVVQSSGAGKTRLLFQHSIATGKPLFYACFRDVKISGYPSGTGCQYGISNALVSETSAHAFVKSLCHCIASMDDSTKAQHTRPEMTSQQNVSSNQAGSIFQSFWSTVLQHFEKFQHVYSIPAAAVNAGSSQPASMKSQYVINYIVVFDEASALLQRDERSGEVDSPFFMLRRAIFSNFALLTDLGIMFVLVDTTSKVANFSPSKSQGSNSMRYEKYGLLPPFCNVANSFNLFWSTTGCLDVNDSNVLLFGRPLWWTTHKEVPGFSSLLANAKAKLICTDDNFISLAGKHDKESAASAAIVCCLLDLPTQPGRQLSIDLIGSHMAYCVGISEDRHYSRCVYLNEPILHAAALSLLHENTETILRCVREQFARADLGWTGEFAAQIVCLLCAQKPSIRRGGDASDLNQPLAEFLDKLLADSQSDEKHFVSVEVPQDGKRKFNHDLVESIRMVSIKDHINALFPNAEVRILRFQRLQRAPLASDLPMYYMFGIAIVLKRNNKSSDLGIVVRYRLTPDSDCIYTMILIQVKNVADSYSTNECMTLIHEMELQHVLEPAFSSTVMPFGPTARSFDSEYQHNTPDLISRYPIIRILMKVRLSFAEERDVKRVYGSFYGKQNGQFYGVVRGIPSSLDDECFTTKPIKTLLQQIVADNERAFHHEQADNFIYTTFRTTCDLLDAGRMAAHQSCISVETKRKMMEAFMTNKPLFELYQLYQSQQLDALTDLPTLKTIASYFKSKKLRSLEAALQTTNTQEQQVAFRSAVMEKLKEHFRFMELGETAVQESSNSAKRQRTDL